jgi:hypothetical protein
MKGISVLLFTVILLTNCTNKETVTNDGSPIKIHNLPRIQNNIGALNDLFIPYGDDIDRLNYLMTTSQLFLIQLINNPDGLTEQGLLNQLIKTDYPQCIRQINTRRKMFADDGKTKMGRSWICVTHSLEGKRKLSISFLS